MLNLDKIHEGMDVLTSDGQRLGAVREIMGHMLFLDGVTSSPEPDRTSVPMIWIIDIGQVVHLAKSREQVEKEWQAGAKSSL
ncbi:DUF2171 domain-containing protein [Microvirga sp. 2TAF3]|uniref:DUF2171 domain-containing protein n=1 Tax=Microvirga sp. 2TAF3 TaxID=3233014 RepID=UPI003F984791